jgi:hypothetical protein
MRHHQPHHCVPGPPQARKRAEFKRICPQIVADLSQGRVPPAAVVPFPTGANPSGGSDAPATAAERPSAAAFARHDPEEDINWQTIRSSAPTASHDLRRGPRQGEPRRDPDSDLISPGLCG